MNIQLIQNQSFSEAQIKEFLKNGSYYSLEEFYLKTIKSNINFDDFIDFKVQNIRKRVEQNNIWQVIDDSNNLVAIFGLQQSPNRSENFGLEYYEINPMFNFSKNAYDALRIFEQEVLFEQAKKYNIQYLKVKINASDYYNIDAFCKSNYTFIGTSLNLYLKKERLNKDHELPENLEFKIMDEIYIEPIKDILKQHNHNEDFYDIDIEGGKTQDNFYNWLYKCYLTDESRQRNNTEIILLYDNNQNEIVGFSCYTKEPSFSKKFELDLITRDLTIIPEKYHNKGYGGLLFDEIMRRENKNVELKLMSNNYKAIGFNHRKGFKQVNSSHFFRKMFI